MIEWLDMGKYDFYVWTSIGIFLAGLGLDHINIKSQRKKVQRNIKAKLLRTKNRSKQA